MIQPRSLSQLLAMMAPERGRDHPACPESCTEHLDPLRSKA